MSGFSASELYPPSPPPPTPLAAETATHRSLSVGLMQTPLAGKPREAPTTLAGGRSLPNHLRSESEDHLVDSREFEGKASLGGEGQDGAGEETVLVGKGEGLKAEGETAASDSTSNMENADPGMERTDPGMECTDPRMEHTDPRMERTDPGMEQTDPEMAQTDSGTARNESRYYSTSDFFVTPASSPHLTPPPSPRPARIGDRVAAKSADLGRRHQTFFSSLPAKFADIELLEGEGIPSEQFLRCCQAVLPFFGESLCS